MKTGAELERGEWTVSVWKRRFASCCSAIDFSPGELHFVTSPVSAESKAWSQRLHGHDYVHDRPGESGVPALEEGARADR